tara:strand:- start:129 stop:431 length:303 start_codon:yes stop_codon:yes gene_type:complete
MDGKFLMANRRPTHAFGNLTVVFMVIYITTAGQKINQVGSIAGGNVGPMNSQIPILIIRGIRLLLPVRQLIAAVFVVVNPVLSRTTRRIVRSGRQEKQQQ